MTLFYLFTAIGCLLITLLAINVSRIRMREKITHGDKDNKQLRNAVIAHANAIEQIIPFALILFILLNQNTNHIIVQILAVFFIIVRIIHAIGISKLYYTAWKISAATSYFITIFSSILILYNII